MKKSRIILAALSLAACAPPKPATPPAPQTPPYELSVLPLPQTVELDESSRFRPDSLTTVSIDAAVDSTLGLYVQSLLAPIIRTGPARLAAGSQPPANSIYLKLDPTIVGDESYDLLTTPSSVTIKARSNAGLFYGIQTLRQLFPSSIEHPAAVGRRLWIPTGHIADSPRFEWRGMMLDVSRHFLEPDDVKRFIDHLALYKINRLHLHLADDQGWRIEIKSRPSLTAIGGSTQVGGGKGGFYTQDEYRDLVAYAAARYITIVPEIDMPGHTNAALASIPELNCDGVSPPLYTGIRVGFSALCVDSARIYPVLEDIVREISAMTPGPYFHIGGDEVTKLTHPQYLGFIEKMQSIVNANGKRMIGWGEIAPAQLSPQTIVQNWKKDSSFVHAARGGKVIVSASSKLYLDMQYDTTTALGLHWAGYNTTRTAYDWEPATFIPGVQEASIIGVEAPLWAETVIKVEDYEYLAFPRIIAAAELGWTRHRDWEGFNRRLQLHDERLKALGINAGR
ncbi:MAG TPA: family 20 glycosylhydrolase [Gemmatimonadaceae bacterium]